ncbi:alpha/beta hydrolase [Piscinibacter defluvii]|uniref:alpha/beta hydrolase n=1 Tax=Piscinibacter defluvii TaxID=1796922 RepID=UPI000FDD9CFF|nr:alpha/beta hydrolase [Piscinibacter defluvii]
MTPSALPPRFAQVAGPLPAPGAVPDADRLPYETVAPAAEGFIERGGVALWHAVWGERGPWIAFAQPFQIVHSQLLKQAVPYLSQHFRVLTMDGRGNGRSGRPRGQEAYSFDHFHDDFVAVLDALRIDRVALVGHSAAAMIALRVAAEQPERVSHLVTVGGFADSLVQTEAMQRRMAMESELLERDWPGYLDYFMSCIFSEPHSTKAYEDGVHYGWATDREVIQWVRHAWINLDLRDHARRVRCPTLVMHGDDDRRVPHAKGAEIHALVPGARLLTIGGGGHVPMARDPVVFNRALREFVGGPPAARTWVRGMQRARKALFISSPIGLGHVQRDLAIARELRKLQPDLAIDWFTVDPAAAYLQREGEHVHPITARLANESRHFERCAGSEHDLSAFFALRTMDEVMTSNFMTFSDLMEAEHYDLVIGDEAWDVDYQYHENPELKRQRFVFLTDFVGCLPMNPDDPREVHLCTDRNADDIEHVARYPHVRDLSLFVGNREDVTEQAFGPGLPGIRDWTDRNFCYCGYCLPFDPAALADTEALRARHGYGRDEKVVIASVGGTAVGARLLQRIAQAFPQMKRQCPELRMILVTGPRLATEGFAPQPGLELRPYVHKLFEHLACCDLALVQGGLSTTMELVATRRPFLSFPLQHHFEQCVHVRQRLANYAADRSMDFATLDPDTLARRALQTMHEPVRYRPVETDGAARAARRIAEVLENRHWAR